MICWQINARMPALEDRVTVFWSEQKPQGHVAVSPNRPYVDAAVIKRLGEPHSGENRRTSASL